MKQKIENRNIDDNGQVLLNAMSLFDSLFINPDYINKAACKNSKEIEIYNKWAKIYDLPIITEQQSINHDINQKTWKMSKEYKDLNIEEYILGKCNTKEQFDRCAYELKLYAERNLYDLLRYLVYLVDIMRKNSIVWGVGRGSSVSSYCLFIIGLHKIDSIKYKLDIHEFLK